MHIYEQLPGEKGKKIFYRAERFPASSLFGKLSPRVEIGDDLFEVQDISMTGLALRARPNRLLGTQVGQAVDYRLRVGKMVLHEGAATVSRVHRGAKNIVVGLGLTRDYLNVAELVERHQSLLIHQDLRSLVQPSEIDPAYRLLMADVLDMLRRYQSFLASQKCLANGVKPVDENRLREVLELCEEQILPEWRDLWHRANGMVQPLMGEPGALQAAKQYTERLLTPELMVGPIWIRAYRKPLGYPGDYLLMDQVYRWQFEGDTPYAKLVHRLGLESAKCVATRMAMVQTAIAGVLGAGAGTARIASIGAGTAQEVHNVLQQGKLNRAVEFTLIDQERDALAHAYDNAYPLTVSRTARAAISCLQVSFMEMVKGATLLEPFAQQDLIYSMGLVDYVGPHRARSFVSSLYRRLKPGGTLIIGNLKESPGNTIWPMEMVCDWSLHYRNAAQMLAMAEGLEVADCRVESDATGHVLMLYLRSPAAQ